MKPTKEEILHYFTYDRERGLLIWKNHWHGATALRVIGTVAGTVFTKDEILIYRVVTINTKLYFMHRLIWFLENETWPKMIDHRDGNGSNNRIENLRASNSRRNQQNRYTHRSGRLVGCYWNKRGKIWISQISINKKRKCLGRFATEQEAHTRYVSELQSRGL